MTEGLGFFIEDGQAPPVHLPSLGEAELAAELEALRNWVASLVERFPHSLKLPPCWAWHGDVVELLAALRDHERYAFSGLAGAGGAVEWHRALRDVEARLDMWTRRFRCELPGSRHPTPTPLGTNKPMEAPS